MADEDNKKVLDIKSGHTPPEATSRPVIVTNRAMVKDPTVKDNDDNPPKKEDKKIIKSEAKPLKPVTKGLVANKEASEEDDTAADEKAQAEDSTKASDTELTAEEKAQQEKVAKLITSGKYVVPVGHIERNQRLRKILSVVVLILLVTGFVGWLLMKNKHK